MALRPELSSMDKDTILFIRKNRIGLAYHWDFYKKNKSLISKKFLNDPPFKVLYKVGEDNGSENWVDFDLSLEAGRYNGASTQYTVDEVSQETIVTRDYEQDCCDKSFAAGNYLASQMNMHIPCANYIDAEGYEYTIGLNDGIETYVMTKRFNAGGTENNSIVISQGSMENKSLSFQYRHLMEDLKLNFKEDVPKNVIVSLNSQIAPLVQDNANQHVGWIKGGLNMLSHMNNSFTRDKNLFISDPLIVSSEPAISNIKFKGYFMSNKDNVVFGVSDSGIYRCTNLGNIGWTKCTTPELYLKYDKTDSEVEPEDVTSENIIVLPILDRSKLTNKIIAFDIQDTIEDDDNYEYKRRYSVSDDNGVTWQYYDCDELLGSYDKAFPVFLPNVDGIYLTTESDGYKTLKHSVNGTAWDNVSANEINGYIKIKSFVGTDKNFIDEYADINPENVPDVYNWVYRVMYAGKFENYTPNTFKCGKTLYIKGVDGKWSPLLYGENSYSFVYGDDVVNNGLIKSWDLDKFLCFVTYGNETAIDPSSGGHITGFSAYVDNWEGVEDASVTRKLKVFYGFADKSNYSEAEKTSSYAEFKIVLTDGDGDYVNDKVYVIEPITLTDSNVVKLANLKQVWKDDGVEGHENNPQIKYGGFFRYRDMNIALTNIMYNMYNGTENELYSQIGISSIADEDIHPDKIRDVENTVTTTVDWSAASSAKHETVVGGSSTLFGDFKYTDILFNGNNTILIFGDRFVETGTGQDYTDLSSTPLGSFGYNYRLEVNAMHHYGIRLKAYRWSGVNMTQQIKARYITDPSSEINVSSSAEVPTKIGFPININPNAFMLIYNGLPIIDDSVYVNPENPKEIICENLYRYKIMQQYINPIQFIKDKREWIYNDFAVINFSAEDPTKECFMFLDKGISSYYGKRCMVDFHSDIRGDLVLFNGIDHEFIINPRTKRKITYIMSRYGLQEAVFENSPYNHIGVYNIRSDIPRNIYRIQFCLKDKMN